MKIKTKLLSIAKDDYPLELVERQPIRNFIRKLLLGSHYECWACYEKRKGIKVVQSPIREGEEEYETTRLLQSTTAKNL